MDKSINKKAYWAIIRFVTISNTIRKYGIDLKLDERYYSPILYQHICNIIFRRFRETNLFTERILGFVCMRSEILYQCEICSSEVAEQLFRVISFCESESYEYELPCETPAISAIVDYSTFTYMVDTVTSTMIRPEEHHLVAISIMNLKRILNFYNTLQQQQDNIYCLIEIQQYNDIDIDTIEQYKNSNINIQEKRRKKMLEENQELTRESPSGGISNIMYYDLRGERVYLGDFKLDKGLHRLPSFDHSIYDNM